MSTQVPHITAKKDCPKCKARRIRCDRTLPRCRKCFSRSLNCPGYGVILRWNQGVASRGKFMRKLIPSENALEARAKLSGEAPLTSQQDIMPPDALCLTLPNSGPRDSMNNLFSHLMYHFDQNVAAKLAWVDGPGNPWRNIILPLSHASPAVLCSVLAIASSDLAYRYGTEHHHFQRLQAVALHYQDKTLSLLAQQLSVFLETPCSFIYDNQARCALASILLLYNLELLIGETAQWRIHIQGARAIIQWKSQGMHAPGSFDHAYAFLLYEYYYASVFIALTTFELTDDIYEVVFTNDSITVFNDFVRIMHTMTRAERLKFRNSSDSQTPRIEDVMRELEAARSRTIEFSQAMEFRSHEVRRDFQYLIHIYYHASLIYSLRVLSDGVSFEDRIQLSRNAIVEHLSVLTESAYFAHDLVWPLFIAGTECRGLPDMQKVIEHAMLGVIRISGRLDRHRVLSFLKMFWQMDLDRDITWIHLVRENPADHSFLII